VRRDPRWRRWLRRLRLASLALCAAPLVATAADGPPRFEVPVAEGGAAFTFLAYGDTRFSTREQVANPYARQALVAKMATEDPAAIFIGGDLVYEGADAAEYAIYKSETAAWAAHSIPVFPALGNHEFRDCDETDQASPCLDHWWDNFPALHLRPYRWYAVSLGTRILALILDSDSALKPGSTQRAWFEQQVASADPKFEFLLVLLHYPPVRDPLLPRGYQEAEIAHYFAKRARLMHARVIVIGSHVHNYERYARDGVTYLVSGGGGAKPVPSLRMFGELSKLRTSVNFHYLRFTLANGTLTATMVRFDAAQGAGNPWSEPDRFEVDARK
jgi:hypothetical protein